MIAVVLTELILNRAELRKRTRVTNSIDLGDRLSCSFVSSFEAQPEIPHLCSFYMILILTSVALSELLHPVRSILMLMHVHNSEGTVVEFNFVLCMAFECHYLRPQK